MKLPAVLEDSKNIILAISFIIASFVGMISYFAKAADLKTLQQDYYQNKVYNRLNYLDQRMTDLELKFNCFGDDCKTKMPLELYRDYKEKQTEKQFIEKSIIKPEDIK